MKLRRMILGLLICLLLAGCGPQVGTEDPAPPEGSVDDPPVELETLLADIYAAVPGTAGSTLKAVYAAGELLDHSMDRYGRYNDPDFEGPDEPEEEDFQNVVSQWVAEHIPAEETIPLVWAWDAVMTQAEALLAEDPETLALLEEAGYTRTWDGWDEKYLNWQYAELSPLYTQLLDRVTAAPYREEPGDFAAVSADRFNGLWLNSEDRTLLIFNNGLCRVVDPGLSLWGEVAGAYRVRDRSELGYCPALEIDFRGEGPMNENGDFYAPIAYYVSGMDDSHFWCNSQWERFDRVDILDETA